MVALRVGELLLAWGKEEGGGGGGGGRRDGSW